MYRVYGIEYIKYVAQWVWIYTMLYTKYSIQNTQHCLHRYCNTVIQFGIVKVAKFGLPTMYRTIKPIRLTFHGAAKEVTGSNHLLEVGSEKILVDCGLFQGYRFAEEKNYEQFPYDCPKINTLILTHAHLDHCGRIPKLLKEGFRGKIYSTAPTAALAEIILLDSAHLMKKEAEQDGHAPLFTEEDVAEVLSYFETVKYNQRVTINEDISFRLKDAGHILGSAFVEIDACGKKFLFSGDLGNSPAPIIGALSETLGCDVLVTESTYGNRVHEDVSKREEQLKQIINETIQHKGVLLIPAFALERTQELLHALDHLLDEHQIPETKIILDSPLAIKATNIFEEYSSYFNKEDRKDFEEDNFFRFKNLVTTVSHDESERIVDMPSPKIIIAGAGMMNGGRVLHHARNYLGDSHNTLLIVGYQAANSLGRRLLEGERVVRIYGEDIQVNAKIFAIGSYSAHADQKQIVEWLSKMQYHPKKIFLVHGEEHSQDGLKDVILDKFQTEVIEPEWKQTFEL